MEATQERSEVMGEGAREQVCREVDFAKLSGGPWDGRRYSYIPHSPAMRAPQVAIFSGSEAADPVTYQVIRWKLWGINLEHADTIKRLSGTRVIVYADDFATSILSGAGDNIVMSPTIQYFGGMADLVVNWTLENRSVNPGIADGDVFLQNDPYIGTAHQTDTAMFGPVFWEGQIVCWVYNCCHMGDIGGIEPGSFCVEAKDIYDEPVPIPPIRIAQRHVLQADVAEMFARQSRIPDLVMLQLRSQHAGFIATRARILALIEQYGCTIVAGVMERIVDDCSQAVKRRLESIPDGTWSERIYAGGIAPDDRDVHAVVTTLRKEGDTIICSNAGTAAQLAAGNGTYSSWRAALLCAVSNILAFDQMGCPAGLLRHLRFEPTPGLFNCAIHPGAVTTLAGTLVSVACAGQAMSSMVLSGPDALRGNARAAGGGTSHGLWSLSWLNPNGQRVADMIGAGIISGLGASGNRDGVDQGGLWIAPTNVAGDIEEWEEAMPMLFLYRRDGTDSGGPGRFRGGNGTDIAIVPHRGTEVRVQTFGSDAAINLEPGLSGGYPGRAGDFGFVAGSRVQSHFTQSQSPADPDAVHAMLGRPERMHSRAAHPMTVDDIFLVGQSGSGGSGDPLGRTPKAVAFDVAEQAVSEELAARIYGVILDSAGDVNAAATEARRSEIRADRRRVARPAPRPCAGQSASGDLLLPVGDTLVVTGRDGVWHWGCGNCGAHIQPITANYKLGCSVISGDPHEMEPARFPSPSDFGDIPMVAQQYLCPQCATVLAFQFSRAEDPAFEDIRLETRWLDAHAQDLKTVRVEDSL